MNGESSEASFGNPRFYERRARAYDAMVGSPLYNKLAWGTHPDEYAAFAARAIGSERGPLKEVAAGTASATALLHIAGGRECVISDISPTMLALARSSVAAAGGGTVPAHISFEVSDMRKPASGKEFQTILGLGLLHLVPDVPALLDALLGQLSPGGTLFLGSLVQDSRRSNSYLRLLQRRGDIAAIRTPEQLLAAAQESVAAHVELASHGAMAYLTVSH